MLWILSLLALLLCAIHTAAESAVRCRTQAIESGMCVPIAECESAYALVQRIQNSNAIISDDNPDVLQLRQLSCGKIDDVYKVCCTSDQIRLNPTGFQILNNGTCGVFSLPKISGGQMADLYAFPWMTLLKYKNNRFLCGGSLISDRYVLTAAHCVTKKGNPVLEVRLGEHNISSEEDCMRAGRHLVCAPPVEDIGIEDIILPPEWNGDLLHHDIALLRLNRTVEFTKDKRHIKPICLPILPALRKKVPEDYIIAGFGRTENSPSSDVLLWTRLPHRKLEECEQLLGVSGLTEQEICAGGEELKDSCKGDSGGPLAQTDIYNKQSRLVQFGIVAAGVDWCGQVSAPAIYTSVAHYLPWITNNLKL